MTTMHYLLKQNLRPYKRCKKPISDGYRNLGILTDRLMEAGANSFDFVWKPGAIALNYCKLSKMGLEKIDLIQYHKYVTYLNLSRNYLIDVSCLSYLINLKYLDVSSNLLSTLLEFTPPLYLSTVIYAHNLIEEIPDLTDFWSIQYLDLSYNLITNVAGLSNLRYLNYLDISNNYITELQLSEINVDNVYAQNNQISNVIISSDLETNSLHKCRTIRLDHNYIKCLKFVEFLQALEELDLAHNDIKSLIELGHLRMTRALRILNLKNNPIIQNVHYFNTVLRNQMCDILDGICLSAEQKVLANYHTSEDFQVQACKHSAILNATSNIQNRICGKARLPLRSQLKVFALVGPIGSHKKAVLRTYQSLFPKSKIVLGVSHTTREKNVNEIDGVDYHFVTLRAFNQLLQEGRFVTCVTKYGKRFGICEDEFRKAGVGSILCFSVHLKAAFQLLNKYPNCKLVLAIPKSVSTHRKWLEQHFEIKSAFMRGFLINHKVKKYETSEETNEKRVMVTSILDEIINYIEHVHEGQHDVYVEQDEYTDDELAASIQCDEMYTLNSSSEDVTDIDKLNKKEKSVSFSTLPLLDYDFDEQFLLDFLKQNKKQLPKNDDADGNIQPDYKFKKLTDTSWMNADDYSDMSATIAHMPSYSESNVGEESSERPISERRSLTVSSLTSPRESSKELNTDLRLCFSSFIEEQLRMRAVYLKTFEDNPGLSFCTVHTDEMQPAIQCIHHIYTNFNSLSAYKTNQREKQFASVKNEKMISSRSKRFLNYY